MMSLRARIFIILSVVVLLILGVSIFLYIIGKKAPATVPSEGTTTETSAGGTATQTPTETGAISPTPTIPAGAAIKQPTTLENEQNGVKQLGRVFVERYGSFSTQNDYQNIKDVESLVTATLWKRISKPLSGAPASSEFMAVTTVIISATMNSWLDSAAIFDYAVRKTTEKGGTSGDAYQQIRVNFSKNNNQWLVNSFETLK